MKLKKPDMSIGAMANDTTVSMIPKTRLPISYPCDGSSRYTTILIKASITYIVIAKIYYITGLVNFILLFTLAL